MSEIITVITPHFVSIKDAQVVVDYCKKFSPLKIYSIVNRVRGDLVRRGVQMTAQEAFIRLGITPLGIIPDSDVLNGFCRKDSPFFDIIADNLLNDKQVMFDYVRAYEGFWGKWRARRKSNA